jgi:hypothetical protein
MGSGNGQNSSSSSVMVDEGDEDDDVNARVNGASDGSRPGTTRACATLREIRKCTEPK